MKFKIVYFPRNSHPGWAGHSDWEHLDTIYLAENISGILKLTTIFHEFIHIICMKLFPYRIATFLNLCWDWLDDIFFLDFKGIITDYRYYYKTENTD